MSTMDGDAASSTAMVSRLRDSTDSPVRPGKVRYTECFHEAFAWHQIDSLRFLINVQRLLSALHCGLLIWPADTSEGLAAHTRHADERIAQRSQLNDPHDVIDDRGHGGGARVPRQPQRREEQQRFLHRCLRRVDVGLRMIPAHRIKSDASEVNCRARVVVRRLCCDLTDAVTQQYPCESTQLLAYCGRKCRVSTIERCQLFAHAAASGGRRWWQRCTGRSPEK